MSLLSERPARLEFGKQLVVVELDDILLVRVRGTLNGEEAREIQAAMFECGKLFGPYDFLVDLREMDGFDGPARRIWVHADRPYPFRNMYLIGASFAAKTLIMGIYRAGRVLQSSFFDFPLSSLETENEVRAVIAQRRSERRGS